MVSHSLNRRAALVLLGAPAAAALPSIAAGADGRPPIARSLPDGDWGAKRAALLNAREAERADYRHGALRAAYDLDERRRADLFAEYGSEDATRADPVGNARLRAIFEKAVESEEHHHQMFECPRWDAFNELIETPPPSIAAFREKLRLAKEEGLPEGEDVIKFVLRDLDHLFGEA